MAKTKRIKTSIAFLDNIVTSEELPYPIVYYPGFYGAFFTFSVKPDNPQVFCSCARVSIENYIALRILRPIPRNADATRMFILDSLDFPFTLVSTLLSKNPSMGNEVLSHLQFEDRICHKCNQAVPSYRYCHEMYGTIFIQSYGWYVRQTYFRLGIWPDSNLYLPDVCPIEYQTEIETLKRANLGFEQDFNQLQTSGSRERRAFTKKIENIVREEFGIRKVGEGWISETILYQIVSKVCSEYQVLFHHRPAWLDGLELDIYIPAIKTAFEYQGIQHYHPIKVWGGKKAFEALKRRDAQKGSMCEGSGIRLIKVDYTEPLTEGHIRELLDNS